jgi:hypothetical protein
MRHTGSDSREAEALLDQGRAALEALRRAAACPRCDWGPNKTLELPLADFSAARRLAVLAALRADRAVRGGDLGAALDDLLAVMALGRHLGQGLYLCGMAGFPMEDLAGDRLQGLLDKLDRETCRDLAARLDALPPLPDLAAAVRAEQDYFRASSRDWLAALDEAEVGPAVRAQFGESAEEMLRASGGSKARLLALADETLRAFDRLVSAAEGHTAELAALREAAPGNPLLADVLHSFDRVRPLWQRFQAQAHQLADRVAAAAQGAGADRGPR